MKIGNAKIWIIFSLVAVFAAGVAAGVWGEKYAMRKKWERREKDRPQFLTLDYMASEMNLREDQIEAIREVFRKNEDRMKEVRTDLHRKFGEIRSLLKSDIEAVLDADQREKFQAMIDAYTEARKAYDEKMKKSRPAPRGPSGGSNPKRSPVLPIFPDPPGGRYRP
jgi:Spy/CpxP family protein refolding chaperone